MKKKVLIWEIIGFLTVCALSGVFHFIYDWSGKQAWIGFFCPVNESTWEHLKLLFFPVLIFSAIEYIWIRKESKNFIAARVTGTVLGMFTIIAVSYTHLYDHIPYQQIVHMLFGCFRRLNNIQKAARPYRSAFPPSEFPEEKYSSFPELFPPDIPPEFLHQEELHPLCFCKSQFLH